MTGNGFDNLFMVIWGMAYGIVLTKLRPFWETPTLNQLRFRIHDAHLFCNLPGVISPSDCNKLHASGKSLARSQHLTATP